MDRALDPRLEDPVAGGVEVKQRGRGAVGPDTPLDGARQLPDLRASRPGRVPPNASALPENVPAGLRDAARYSPGGQNLARQPTLAKRVSQRSLVSCPRKLWTKRRAGRGGPCAEHAESQPAPGNRKEPRECGFRLRQRAEATVPRRGPPAPPGARESTDFWDTTLERGGKVGAAHQVGVHAAGRAPRLADGPDDEGLAALHVAGREDARQARHPVPVPPDIAALGELDAELLEHPGALGADESHGEERQLAGEDELGAGDLLERDAAVVLHHLDLRDLQRPEVPPLVAEKALGRDRVDAIAALLVRGGDALDIGPLGPRVVGRPPFGRARQDLELVDGERALAVHRAETVGPGVPPADDDDVPAAGADEALVQDEIALAEPILQRQVLHGEVDPPELPSGDRQIAWGAGPAAEQEGVELPPELFHGDGDPHVAVDFELDALDLHLIEAPVEDALLHLELGDPVAQEPADPVLPLEDGHPVAGAVELLGRGEPRRPRADHRHLLAGPHRGRHGGDPARLPGVVDDRQFDGLDRDGVVVDPEHAGALARRWAERAREFGEVVRRVQPVDGLAPPVAVHEVVPVGDEVPEGTALMTEGNAAVHAAGALLLELLCRPGEHDLLPVAQTLFDPSIRLLVALELDEPGDLTHSACPWHLRAARLIELRSSAGSVGATPSLGEPSEGAVEAPSDRSIHGRWP